MIQNSRDWPLSWEGRGMNASLRLSPHDLPVPKAPVSTFLQQGSGTSVPWPSQGSEKTKPEGKHS